jgi:hypothetical protein
MSRLTRQEMAGARDHLRRVLVALDAGKITGSDVQRVYLASAEAALSTALGERAHLGALPDTGQDRRSSARVKGGRRPSRSDA